MLSFVILLALSPMLLGHYRENPDEATRPPQILREPDFTEVAIGENGALYVHAIGAGTLEYQWFRDDQPVSDSNSNILEFEEVQPESAGFYFVEITNEFGTATSDLVRLRVGFEDRFRVVDRQVSGDQEGVSTIEFYDGYFYAGGPDGELSRSVEGYAWETLEVSPGPILGLVGGDDRLLALMPQGEVAWTEDFENWNAVLVDPDSRDVEQGVHSLGVFAVLVNTISTTRLLTSVDGVNWQVQYEFGEGPGTNILVATNDFIVAARSTIFGTEFVTSSNGVEWSAVTDENIQSLQNGHSLDETVLLLGSRVGYTSADGVTWEFSENLTTEGFEKIVEFDGIYFGLNKMWITQRFVGQRWSNQLQWSTDLREWSDVASTALVQKDGRVTLEVGNGALVYGPIDGTIYPVGSTDEIRRLDFTIGNLDEFHTTTGIQYLFDRFVATLYSSAPFVGGNHTQIQSRNGKSWSGTGAKRIEGLRSLAYGNGVYTTGQIVGSDFESLRSSSDQVSFEPKQLLFGNGVFVGISGADIWYSSNGDNWEKSLGAFNGYRLFFAGDHFFAQGEAGTNAVSNDGSSWSAIAAVDADTDVPLDFQDIGYINGVYLGVENSSPGFRVYESANSVVWKRIDADLAPLVLSVEESGDNEGILSPPLNYIDLVFGEDSLYFLFSGFFAETSDFVNWSTTSYDTSELFEMSYGDGPLVAVSPGGRVVGLGNHVSIPPKAIFRNRSTVYTTPNNSVGLLVDAFDVDGEIEKVEFFVDGKKILEVIEPPFDWEWTAPATGIFDLTAIAEDDSGLKAIDGVTARVTQNIAVGQFDRNMPPGVVDIATLHNSSYALGAKGSIYRSDDMFEWHMAFVPPFEVPLSLDSTRNLLYAPTSTGVYVCHDGKKWIFLTDEKPRSYLRNGDWFRTISRDLYEWSSMKVPSEVDVRFTDLVGYVQSGLFFRLTGYTFQDAFVVNVWGTATRVDLPLGAASEYASTFDGYNYVWTQGATGSALYQSTSLENWSFVNTPAIGSVSRLEKVENLFILEGSVFNQPSPLRYISSDGLLSWKETADFGPIVYGKGLYVGIMDLKIAYSEDGDNWIHPSDSISLGYEGDIVGTTQGFLALDSDGGIYASIDGVQWSSVNRPGFGNDVVDIAHNGDGYVALSEESLYTSMDGADWVRLPKPDLMGSSVASKEGLFVASGDSGRVFVSVDGMDWEEHIVDEEVSNIFSVEYLPEVDRFILETHTEDVWTSEEGINWQSNLGLGGRGFRFEGERLFVYNNGVYSTKDGIDFEQVPHLTSNDSIHFVNGVYLAPVFMGPEQGIRFLRSTDGVEWDVVDSPDSSSVLHVMDTGFVLSNNNHGGGLFSENGID